MISAYCSAAGQDIRILLANHASMIAIVSDTNASKLRVVSAACVCMPTQNGNLGI